MGRPRPGHPRVRSAETKTDGPKDPKDPKDPKGRAGRGAPTAGKRAKHTTAGIRTWSPTVLLVRRFAA